MKQKIRIVGRNVHDLLFQDFLMRMAFDLMVNKFFITGALGGDKTEDGQQVLTIKLDDKDDKVEYFKRQLESRDFNTDEEQLKWWGFMMKERDKVQITKIEYESFDGHVPDLELTGTTHNCRLMGAFCIKEDKESDG